MWTQTPRGNCPAAGKECYNCHGTGHYTTLSRQPRKNKTIISVPLEDPDTEVPKEVPIGVLVIKEFSQQRQTIQTESQPHKKVQKKPHPKTPSSQPPYS